MRTWNTSHVELQADQTSQDQGLPCDISASYIVHTRKRLDKVWAVRATDCVYAYPDHHVGLAPYSPAHALLRPEHCTLYLVQGLRGSHGLTKP